MRLPAAASSATRPSPNSPALCGRHRSRRGRRHQRPCPPGSTLSETRLTPPRSFHESPHVSLLNFQPAAQSEPPHLAESTSNARTSPEKALRVAVETSEPQINRCGNAGGDVRPHPRPFVRHARAQVDRAILSEGRIRLAGGVDGEQPAVERRKATARLPSSSRPRRD